MASFSIASAILAPLRSRISRKIFIFVAAVGVVVMTSAIAVIEYSTYSKSLDELSQTQAVITQGQAIVAAELIGDLDQERLLLALSGTLAHPDIVGVSVHDERGKQIVSFGRTLAKDPALLMSSEGISNFVDDDFVRLGELRTYASTQRLWASLSERMVNLAILTSLAILAIITATLGSVHHIIGRPVALLANAIRSEDEQEPKQVEWSSNDELGLVVDEFNALQRAQFGRIDYLASELSEQQRREGDRLRLLVDAAFEGILICVDGKVTEANSSFQRMAGATRARIDGSPVGDWLPPEVTDAWSGDSRRGIAMQTVQATLQSMTGGLIAVEVISRPIELGGNRGFVVAIRDITERLAVEGRIRHMAMHDELTDLPNRRAFHQALGNFCGGSRTFSLLALDLDGFKQVNDNLGHAAGDELLVLFTSRLRGLLAPGDIAARLGGDEFAVLHPHAVEAVNSEQKLAGSIIRQTSERFVLGDVTCQIGVSIGIACSVKGQLSPDQLLKAADAALYDAKRAGRRTFRMASTPKRAIAAQ